MARLSLHLHPLLLGRVPPFYAYKASLMLSHLCMAWAASCVFHVKGSPIFLKFTIVPAWRNQEYALRLGRSASRIRVRIPSRAPYVGVV